MASEDSLAAIRQQIRTSPVVGAIRDRAEAVNNLADALAGRADAIDALTETLRARAEAADTRAAALQAWATTVTTRLDALTTAVAASMKFRSAIIQLPLLSVGSSPIAVTWDVPFADTSYGVTAIVEAGEVALGKLTAGLKAGTRDANGCTVVVSNAALVSIQAGAQLHVLGWRTPAGS